MLTEFKSVFKNRCLVVLFLLIYTSDDTALFGTNGNENFFIVKYLLLFVISIYLFGEKTHLRNNDIIILIIVLFFFMITAISTGFKIGFLYNLLLLFSAIVFARSFDVVQIKSAFCDIMLFLSCFSLIVYFSNLLIPNSLNVFPQLYNSADGLFITTFGSNVFPTQDLRNFGIFREPGVYMVYLNIAIFFEWFSSSISYKRLFIYFVTLLTTISTGGYAIGAVAIAGGLLKRRRPKMILALIPLFLIIYYVMNYTDIPLEALLFNKFEEGNSNAIVRWASITVPIEMFKDNPLGVGPDGYNLLFPKISSRLYGVQIDPRETTNTFMKLLAVYGLFVFLIYVWGWLRSVYAFYKERLQMIFFAFVLLLAFSNEDLRTSIMFSIFIAIGLTYNKKNEKYRIKNTMG